MSASPRLRIQRRGFRAAPATVVAQAERILAEFAASEGGCLAFLRPATYCGPGSAGDRGAFMLDLYGASGGHRLTSIGGQR